MIEIYGIKDLIFCCVVVVVEWFKLNGMIGRVCEYGNGNVNDIFFVFVEFVEVGCFIF